MAVGGSVSGSKLCRNTIAPVRPKPPASERNGRAPQPRVTPRLTPDTALLGYIGFERPRVELVG
jgi:hypothetical protein